jgi:hypothetical protein
MNPPVPENPAPSSVPKAVLPYAQQSSRTSYWGAAVLCMSGLGLIALAGCFLIGVLILNNSSTPWTTRHLSLALVLYACSFTCLLAALVSLFLGYRRALQ